MVMQKRHGEDLDKIETICEAKAALTSTNVEKSDYHLLSSDGATASTSAATASASPAKSEATSTSFRDRFRHCSESAAAAIVHRFRPNATNNSNASNSTLDSKGLDLHEELFQYKPNDDQVNDNEVVTGLANENLAKFALSDDELDDEEGRRRPLLPPYREPSMPREPQHEPQQPTQPPPSYPFPAAPSDSESPFRQPRVQTSFRATGGLSQSSSTLSMPACRICQLPGLEPNNPLISPCRCLGSIRYVHNNCLLVRMSKAVRTR